MIILAGWLRGTGGCPGNPSMSNEDEQFPSLALYPKFHLDPFFRG
jgi:hypothetical protein